MTIGRETLIQALGTAIHEREIYERQVLKYTGESAYLTTIKAAQKALERGERVEVR